MKAIPRSLLIHQAKLKAVISKDDWGNEELLDPILLDRIRIEPSTKFVRAKDNSEIQLAAVLYYDCKNSKPRNMVFTDESVIVFHEESYRIKLVEPLYDQKRLHHYELGMVRDG